MDRRRASYVHLNGRLVVAADAKVSVFDRGLQFGDGLFETLRAYCGRPFALDQHLERMRRSAAMLEMQIPQRPWARDIEALVRKNRLAGVDARVRITITRGTAPLSPVPPPGLKPTVIITATEVDSEVERLQRRGARVILLPFARGGALAGHKALNYLPAVLGKMAAQRRRAFEALFVGPGRRLSEGTTSNVFVWHRGRLCTPPTHGILPGVTRHFVLQLAAAQGVRVVEKRLAVTDLLEAEEAFLTGSVAEIIPIINAEGQRIGSGRPGVLTRLLQRCYHEMVGAGE
jgi:D-amino acid aminotransferase